MVIHSGTGANHCLGAYLIVLVVRCLLTLTMMSVCLWKDAAV